MSLYHFLLGCYCVIAVAAVVAVAWIAVEMVRIERIFRVRDAARVKEHHR